MKTPDYMSYTKYKKKKNTNSQKAMVVFVTTFFITLLLLVVVARSLSPNVDVSIGEDPDMEAKETGLGVKGFVDDRLKRIQMEDNGNSVDSSADKISDKKTAGYNDASFDDFSKELDERVILPKQKKTIQIEDSQDAVQTPPRPSVSRASSSSDLSTPFESPRTTKTSKVLVGYYSTVEQAKVAQGIILDSGLNITPFIKDLGGAYSLQVGSYSSRAKAESLAQDLLRNNFPARVIQE